jgi:diguanylate cyclase (GGDEF)-like protein
MPPRDPQILVILADGTPVRRLLGRCPRPPFLRLLRRGEAARAEPGARPLAVFVEGAARGAAVPRLRRLLGRLAPGVPVIPFRLARAGGGPPSPGGALALPAPVDPVTLRCLAWSALGTRSLRERTRALRTQARSQRALLRALAEVVHATSANVEPHRVLELAMERVRALLGLRAWLFFLADPEQGVLTVERAAGEGTGGLRGKRCTFADGPAGRAAQLRRPVMTPAAGEEPGGGPVLLPPSLRDAPAVAVPLLSRGRVIGAVQAVARPGGTPPGTVEARVLELLLEPAAVAIDNARLLKRSEELSVTDDLTKLYNSRFLNQALRREVERSRRYRTPVSLIFLDLDGFKDVNDQYGHLWGSRTLVEVGEVVASTVREIDVVSRFGGDEFTVILPQTGPEGATIIAERIRQRIAEATFLQGYGMRVKVTASVGIASFPDHGRTKDELISRADQAMYAVKGRGKNGVALADPAVPRPLPANAG